MTCLADTHLALWLLAGSDRLPVKAREMMTQPGQTWYLSVVSIWEVMLKHQVHPEKMIIDAPTFARDSQMAGFRILGLIPGHVFEAGELPTEGVHKDSFDRMLLAQARYENFALVTHDCAFADYDDSHVILV